MRPVLGVEHGDTLLPLKLLYECCVPLDAIRENLKRTFSTKYERFNEFMSEADQGTISIVGSGPSLARTYDRLAGGKVLACNAAHDFLLSKGIVPDYAMFWDASPVIATMFTPDPRVTYLVASRCSPEVFERLEGHRVIVWHAASDQEPTLDMLEESDRHEPLINGGSAAVVRSMFLVAAMGFRKIRIFGGDGSSEENETHFQKSAVEERSIRVFCNHRWFDTTPWLAAQAEEISILYPVLQGLGIKIEVHGSGLVPHIAGSLGYPVIN